MLQHDAGGPGGVEQSLLGISARLANLICALADCNKLMALAPDADYPYLNRGIVYEKMGDMGAAMKDYVEWIEADQDECHSQ